MTENVVVEIADGVGTVRLNRPDAMNSLDVATKEALLSAVNQVATDDNVRCVVLTGSGRSFCVGQDLKEHVGLLQSGAEVLFRTVDEHYNPIVTALATMPKPVIAAVNGVAAGAGASLAFACDLRLVSDAAGFNLAFAAIALSCDTGSSWTLPRLVGRTKAMEMLYFPRTISAQESLELGIATQVVPAAEFEATISKLATELAAGPTAAYAAIKHSVAFAAEHSFVEALEVESKMMTQTGSSADHGIAVQAFLAKQKPNFIGK